MKSITLNKLAYSVILVFISLGSYSQTIEGKFLPVITINKVDHPISTLSNVVIISKIRFSDPLAEYRFNRLKNNVLTVYPYAIEAARVYNEMNQALQDKDSRRDRKKYIKEKQKELSSKFEEPLKNLTTTQGDILVKLISRYTGKNCYELISEFKNPFSAFFWNSASKFYGYKLKENYDPDEQKDIELIVRSVENNYAAAH